MYDVASAGAVGGIYAGDAGTVRRPDPAEELTIWNTEISELEWRAKRIPPSAREIWQQWLCEYRTVSAHDHLRRRALPSHQGLRCC